MKKAEDTNDIIVRLYEPFGRDGMCQIDMCNLFNVANLTDMMENDLEILDIVDGKVSFKIKPFEIATLKLGNKII